MIFVLREYTVRIKLTSRQEENNLKLSQRSENASNSDLEVLNDSKSTAESREVIEHRRDKYNLLLGSGVKKYFMRMLYPMKV